MFSVKKISGIFSYFSVFGCIIENVTESIFWLLASMENHFFFFNQPLKNLYQVFSNLNQVSITTLASNEYHRFFQHISMIKTRIILRAYLKLYISINKLI